LLNKKVLIIDDVTTTGATIKEVARALKNQYSSVKLYSYCLCKTSEDHLAITTHNNHFDDFL
jgi:predicted amidophosphoribosyltransferase